MQGSMAREWSLWNQLQQGYSRFTNDTDSNDSQRPKTDEAIAEMAELPLYDEKRYPAQIPTRTRSNWWPKVKKLLIVSQLLVIAISLGVIVQRTWIPCDMSRNSFNYLDQSALRLLPQQHRVYSLKNETVPREVIEIPILPELDYGKAVYNQTLVKDTFGNCWGHPVTVKYHPPPAKLNFTKIVLTLDISVDGVQYDRLLHVYIDNEEIWRSSTAEPAGLLTHTHTQKDVSTYGHLFTKKTEIMLQLDNILTPRLTGSFDVVLKAFYYDTPEDDSPLPEDPDAKFKAQDLHDVIIPGQLDQIFNNSEASQHVIPLIDPPEGRPPLIYYPNTDFKVTLPKVNTNTTSVRLMIYLSGNGEEEFWYSNLLDEFKDRFKKRGHTFGGHGPCRMVNVYYGSERIGSASPFPVIYTGGLSPALWNPIVSTGAFDIGALEFDVSPLLPILWKEGAELSIDVSNCIDDDLPIGEKASGIGSNWISSANLAVWESPSIKSASGTFLGVTNYTKVTAFGINPPFSGFLSQIVTAKYNSTIASHLNYTLADDTNLDFISQFYTKASQTNIQIIRTFGDGQSVVSVPKQKTSMAYFNPDGTLISKYNLSNSYALAINLETDPIPDPVTDYQINVTKHANFKALFNGTKLMQIKNLENGTSNFTLSPSGNHGIGIMEHNYTLTTHSGESYNRHALADNGTIVYDNVTFPTAAEGAMLLDDEVAISPNNVVNAYLRSLGFQEGLLTDDDEEEEFFDGELQTYQAFMEQSNILKDMPEPEFIPDSVSDNRLGLIAPALLDRLG